MSEPLCLECLFKRNKKVITKKLDLTTDCKKCANGTKSQKCIDGCGTTMIWCKIVKCWHNGDKLGRCPKYKERKVKKKT